MTMEEYKDFKAREKQIKEEAPRFNMYEVLCEKMDRIEHSISKIKTVQSLHSLDAYSKGSFIPLEITDSAFFKEKLLEMAEHEKRLLQDEIDNL